MCTLKIKQGYETVTFKFDSPVDAAIMAENLMTYTDEKTTFTISLEEKEGEE